MDEDDSEEKGKGGKKGKAVESDEEGEDLLQDEFA